MLVYGTFQFLSLYYYIYGTQYYNTVHKNLCTIYMYIFCDSFFYGVPVRYDTV